MNLYGELYAGGVSALGPLQTEGPEAELGWRQMLHNHYDGPVCQDTESGEYPCRLLLSLLKNA